MTTELTDEQYEKIVSSLSELGYGKSFIKISLIPTLSESAKYFGRTLEEEVDNFCDFVKIIRKKGDPN